MNYSNPALYAFLFKERLRMTNAQCWKQFPDADALAEAAREHSEELERLTDWFSYGEPLRGVDGMICPFDDTFPHINPAAPMGDRPFLLFYRGDLSLLEDLNRNVAVIGAIDPDEDTVSRERTIVSRLVEKGLTIVSGLAKGCDAAAHQACLDAGGKTVAILPSHLEKIYPAQNRGLAEQIVESGGLLLTEYASEAKDRFSSVKRFTDRDRLQALFSKAVLLIASHRKGEGDSGSRYAMESAKKYQLERYVMFDQAQDREKPLFAMNRDFLASSTGVKILKQGSIEELASLENRALARTSGSGEPDGEGEQITLDLG